MNSSMSNTVIIRIVILVDVVNKGLKRLIPVGG